MAAENQTVITVATVIGADADVLEDFVNETTAVLRAEFPYHEILIIDNGAPPDFRETVAALQKRVPNLRLLGLSRGHDMETAWIAALDHAIGDYVVLIEADGDPPELIPTFVNAAIEGADIVIGKTQRTAELPWQHRALSRLYHSVAKRLLESHPRGSAAYFRVLSRTVVNSITRIRNKRRSLKYFSALVGFRQKHISYERRYRHGKARRQEPLHRAAARAFDMLVSNSATPLRAAALLGVIACMLNLAYLLYILIVTLVKRQLAEGWLSTSLMNTVMFLCVFVILSVLSEYVYRILEETRDRPLYFVEYETTSNATTFQKTVEEQRVNVL